MDGVPPHYAKAPLRRIVVARAPVAIEAPVLVL